MQFCTFKYIHTVEHISRTFFFFSKWNSIPIKQWLPTPHTLLIIRLRLHGFGVVGGSPSRRWLWPSPRRSWDCWTWPRGNLPWHDAGELLEPGLHGWGLRDSVNPQECLGVNMLRFWGSWNASLHVGAWISSFLWDILFIPCLFPQIAVVTSCGLKLVSELYHYCI